MESADSSDGPSPARTPEEELQTFQVDSGLKVELVAAEPLVEDPVFCTFDEDGRLWVVEMRAYMPNLDGEGEREPIGRVSVLEDSDGDGQMDKSTVYMDSLVMPRSVAVVKGGALVVYEEDLWMTTDTDGDLKADVRTLIDSVYTTSLQPEHAANGLWRGIDNWYYNAKSRLRYRLEDGRWIRDSTEFRGQWGISHDDAGRLYYNYNWSQLHADLVPPDYMSRNKHHTPSSGVDQNLTLDKRVYPARPTPAVNRGYIPGILDDKKRLTEFTAACSPFVYRGTALPKEYYGNAFVCEPSGNLIRRNVILSDGLHLAARNPTPGREFFASTDERFRPVHIAQGPDGAMYVVDMYRGLIQHRHYVTPYLRDQTLERNLVSPIHRGRIWRVVSEGRTGSKSGGKLSTTTTADLINLLSSSDGWYRDMAQRLLVEREDPASLEPLKKLAMSGSNPLGRFHALWALEGLGAAPSDMLLSLADDPDQLIASSALRMLEPFATRDAAVRQRLQALITAKCETAPPAMTVQMAFTAAALDDGPSHDVLLRIVTRYDTSALFRDAVISSIANEEFAFLKKVRAAGSWKEQSPSREVFLEALTGAIVKKGNAGELKGLLAILDVDKASFGWQETSILTGMSVQGLSGKVTPLQLDAKPRLLTRTDLNIADAQLEGLAALFEWPGSQVRDTTQQKGIFLDEKQKEQFALGRKLYLGSCAGCHGNDGGGMNRFAPPLAGSEWVTGDPVILSLIVLHGVEGPLTVSGKRYAEPAILPEMPGHSALDNKTIAAILTYIRNAWGNRAGPIGAGTVNQIRIEHRDRVLPWSSEELQAKMKNEQSATPD